MRPMGVSNQTGDRPWYREPWPWFLMAGPAIVVVAGVVTVWLAVASDDGLVAQDYYRRGLMINKVLGRVEAGARAGLSATVSLREGEVTVVVEGLAEEPGSLRLTLNHPTRAGFDRSLQLDRVTPATYRGRVDGLLPGKWLVAVETTDWRLTGEAALSGGQVARLQAR